MVVQYVIVKYADEVYDTAGTFKHGAFADASAHDTYTGRKLHCKTVYDTEQEAQVKCDEMRKFNPHGYYAVKRVLDLYDLTDRIARLETIVEAANAIASHFTTCEQQRGELYPETCRNPINNSVIPNAVMIPIAMLRKLQQATNQTQ